MTSKAKNGAYKILAAQKSASLAGRRLPLQPPCAERNSWIRASIALRVGPSHHPPLGLMQSRPAQCTIIVVVNVVDRHVDGADERGPERQQQVVKAAQCNVALILPAHVA